MTAIDEARVAEIAAGLTKAQREVLPQMTGEWAKTPDLSPRMQSASVASFLVGKLLAEKKIWAPLYRLTPLGLAVKAHLERSAS
jgi:hypothetical protein